MLRKTLSAMSLLALGSLPVFAENSPASFSDNQKQEIQTIVREYLIQHPDVLMEVSRALQEKQAKEMQNQAKDAVAQNAERLFSSKRSPWIGNESGPVVLVEFFDYQCVHCKHMVDVVDKLHQNNKNLKIVFKQFPIFGHDSEFAARAALASVSQGKFSAFHNALLKNEGRLTNDQVMKIAKNVGLNVKKLKTDMNKPEVTQELQDTMDLARKMHLMGTPAFVVSNTPFNKNKDYFFVPGSSSTEVLQGFIDKAKA